MTWTDENIERLRELWADGKSCSQIAAAIGHGITRNAVIGKAHQLGLAPRAKSNQQPESKTPKAPKPRRRHPIIVSPSVILAPATPFECLRVTFADLGAGACKWLLDNNCYCGNPALWRASYCAYHAGIAYQPTRLRSLAGLAARR